MTSVDLPEIVILSVDRIRRHINNQPELLLETWGAPRSRPGDHCFVDLIGFEDELVDTIQVPEVGPPFEILTPIRQRLTAAMPEPALDTMPRLRTASYRALSGCGRLEVSGMYLPGWRYAPTTGNVGLFLARYKRAA